MGAVMTSRQAAELDYALDRNGFTAEDVKKLSSGNILADVRKVLEGYAEIQPIEHIIDCNVQPLLPESDVLKFVEHRKPGKLRWIPIRQAKALYRSEKCKLGGFVSELRKELEDQPVLNASVLDYLLRNQHLIPESWKNEGAVYFWGTIYRRMTNESLCVRNLCWSSASGGYWISECWDVSPFITSCSVALSAV